MSLIKRQIENDNPELFKGTGLVERLSDDDRMSEVEQEQFMYRVQEEEKRIQNAEGDWKVNGILFSSSFDAEVARGFEAEKRVRAFYGKMDRYVERARRIA